MAGPRVRTFYRLVKSDPPMVEDFKSNCEKGLRRRSERGESIEDWTGISTYDSPDGIRDLLRRAKFSARALWAARIDLPEGAPVESKKTHGPGHWTLWGSSARLHACVVEVVPVDVP